MSTDEWTNWKDWYKTSIREWKQKYHQAIQEYRQRFRDWKNQAEASVSEGQSPPAVPPLPPPPPMIHSVSTSRSNVVASRIGNEELKLIDTLIEAKLFGTRSEAVAYLVSEGIKARQDVFGKVSSSLEEIRKIMRNAEEHVAKLKEETGFAKAKDADDLEEQERTCQECAKDLSNLPDDIIVCPYCQTRLKQPERDTP